jgi:hypothetical protein
MPMASNSFPQWQKWTWQHVGMHSSVTGDHLGSFGVLARFQFCDNRALQQQLHLGFLLFTNCGTVCMHFFKSNHYIVWQFVSVVLCAVPAGSAIL